MSYAYYDAYDAPLSPGEQLEQDVLSLGVRPELLADLGTDDARFVLSGMAKLLSAITHPDRGQAKSTLGLEAADINALSARFRNLDTGSFEEVLLDMSRMSTSVAELRERQALAKTNEQLASRNIELSRDLLRTIEPYIRYSGRLAFGAYIALPGKMLPELELHEAVFEEGVVISSSRLRSTPKFVSALRKSAQQYITEQRPDLDDEAKLVFIDQAIAKKTGLPVHSWCQIITAKGVNDPSKKRAVVKVFDPANSESHGETMLVGSSLFGHYLHENDRDLQQSATWPSLTTAKKVDAQLVAATTAHYIPLPQAEQLLAHGFIESLKDSSELVDVKNLVLKSSPGSREVVYILPGSPLAMT